jgi:hypothetical protein
MKKFFVLMLIIAALVGLYYLTKNKPDSSSVPQTSTLGPTRPDMANLTYSSEDGAIVLKNAKGERAIEGSNTKDEFTLAEMINTTGDLNGDGKTDSAGFIIENSAGTGVFVYVAAAVSGTVSYKGTNAVFIGDRVEPSDITISNGNVIVKYLDRNPDEPMSADPKVSKTVTLAYKNGELIQK